MKPIISVYSESGNVKIAVLSKEKNGVKLHQTIAAHIGKAEAELVEAEQLSEFSIGEDTADISFDDVDIESGPTESVDSTDISFVANSLSKLKLNKAQFIPIASEPGLNYHIFEGDLSLDRSKLLDAIIKDIQTTKNITVKKDSIDYVRFSDTSLLCVFIDGEIAAVNFVDSLALFKNRRYFKIPTIKSAELSVANYVSRNVKFFPEDFTLIVYTEKEYSSLLFLEGDKLKHIGTRLEIGTESSYSYDVYFSKILLEMEKGDIPRLDNVILCGEDTSENFILSFYSTFPEADVNVLKFENVDISALDEEELNSVSSYVIPIAAATEYFDELDKKFVGINLLPKYIQENQKAIQLGWHSYALFPIMFAAAFFFTYNVLSNYKQISEIDVEINRLNQLKKENQVIIDKIIPLEQKIDGFQQSQALLDEATAGTEVWSTMIEKVADFMGKNRRFWVTKLHKINEEELRMEGFSISRKALTKFAEYEKPAILQSLLYEPLREKNTFAFNLTFHLTKNWSE